MGAGKVEMKLYPFMLVGLFAIFSGFLILYFSTFATLMSNPNSVLTTFSYGFISGLLLIVFGVLNLYLQPKWGRKVRGH